MDGEIWSHQMITPRWKWALGTLKNAFLGIQTFFLQYSSTTWGAYINFFQSFHLKNGKAIYKVVYVTAFSTSTVKKELEHW